MKQDDSALIMYFVGQYMECDQQQVFQKIMEGFQKTPLSLEKYKLLLMIILDYFPLSSAQVQMAGKLIQYFEIYTYVHQDCVLFHAALLVSIQHKRYKKSIKSTQPYIHLMLTANERLQQTGLDRALTIAAKRS